MCFSPFCHIPDILTCRDDIKGKNGQGRAHVGASMASRATRSLAVTKSEVAGAPAHETQPTQNTSTWVLLITPPPFGVWGFHIKNPFYRYRNNLDLPYPPPWKQSIRDSNILFTMRLSMYRRNLVLLYCCGGGLSPRIGRFFTAFRAAAASAFAFLSN